MFSWFVLDGRSKATWKLRTAQSETGIRTQNLFRISTMSEPSAALDLQPLQEDCLGLW